MKIMALFQKKINNLKKKSLEGILAISLGIGALTSMPHNANAQTILSAKRGSQNTIEIKADNLGPGDYAIVSKNPLISTNMFAQPLNWLADFTATSTSYTTNLPINKPIDFFKLMSLNDYYGPEVDILSPAPNEVKSNSFNISFKGEDIFPFKSEVWLGTASGKYYRLGTLDEEPASIGVNSPAYDNGPARIYIVSSGKEGIPIMDTDIDGDELVSTYYFQNFATRDISISNKVYALNYHENGSVGGGASFELHSIDDYVNASYTFKVTDDLGNLLEQTTNVFENGKTIASWNETSNGIPINTVGKEYSFSFDIQKNQNANPTTAQNSNLKIYLSYFFSGNVLKEKRLFTCEQWPNASTWQPVRDVQNEIAAMTYAASLGPGASGGMFDRYPYDYWNNYPNSAKVIMQATQTNDVQYIYNALGSFAVGGWIWQGHGGQDTLANGIDGFISTPIRRETVGNLLFNHERIVQVTDSSGKKVSKRHLNIYTPLLETWLLGCATALDSDWATATGTTDGDYLTNDALLPTCFFGFNGISYTGRANNNFLRAINYQWFGWNPPDPYIVPVISAVNSALSQEPRANRGGPVLKGHPLLTFGGTLAP